MLPERIPPHDAEAEQVLQAAVKAYRKGSDCYAAGLLECGRLCGEYIASRLVNNRTPGGRKAAVDVLTLELSLVDGTTVDVNRLVRTYQASDLFPARKAKCQAVAYRTYRDHWCRLLERQSSLGGEQYVLLPGLEAECQEAFAKAVAVDTSSADCKPLVDALVARHATQQAEAGRQQAEALRIEAASAKAAAEKAASELRAAQQATPHDQHQLEAKQRAVVAQQERAETATKKQKAAERRAKVAARAAEKVRDKQRPYTPAADASGGKANPADQRGVVTGNLLTLSGSGMASAADLASLLADTIGCHPAPDDVFERLLRLLAKSGGMGRKAKRAAEAALVIITRSDKTAGPSPVEVANRLPLSVAAP